MKLNERQTEIIRLIQKVRQLDVCDLVERFRISAVTIRKDLDLLQQGGILQRTHGGAVLAENTDETIPVDLKLGRNVEAKEAIAREAFDLIFDCETVAIDSGSTNLALARLLRDTDICVVTNSLLIADELSGRKSGSMVLIGGFWRKETSCFIGQAALQSLDRVNIDMAFIGASGYSVDTGFTCQNSMEAAVKERFLSRTERRFILADSSKYATRTFTTFARFSDVYALVVDNGLSDEAYSELTENGLHLIKSKGTSV